MAVTVQFKNGHSATLPDATEVASVTGEFAGGDLVQGSTRLTVLVCKDAQGKTVGEFILADVAGYYITTAG
jgi:hypothetical protein